METDSLLGNLKAGGPFSLSGRGPAHPSHPLPLSPTRSLIAALASWGTGAARRAGGEAARAGSHPKKRDPLQLADFLLSLPSLSSRPRHHRAPHRRRQGPVSRRCGGRWGTNVKRGGARAHRDPLQRFVRARSRWLCPAPCAARTLARDRAHSARQRCALALRSGQRGRKREKERGTRQAPRARGSAASPLVRRRALTLDPPLPPSTGPRPPPPPSRCPPPSPPPSPPPWPRPWPRTPR